MRKNFLSAIFYGLIPHTFCILFVIFSIIGATTFTVFLKPFLLNKYFFYVLIGLSFLAATISAAFYLKRNGILSYQRIKRKWFYLTILYSTTFLVNLLLFLVIFPITINLSTKSKSRVEGTMANQSFLSLKVSIPCSGHASLISEELKKINGINEVRFRLPNIFDIFYNPSHIDQGWILNQPIFQEFPAKINQ